MVRSLFLFAIVWALTTCPVATAQGTPPALALEPLEIVVEREPWHVFEPETEIEPGLLPAELGDRHAYRAAEFAVEAERYRPLGEGRSWRGQFVFGDGHYTRLYRMWAVELDRAAERSRVLAIRHHLRAYDVAETAWLSRRPLPR